MQLRALSALSFWLSATATLANAWSTNSTIKITAPHSGTTSSWSPNHALAQIRRHARTALADRRRHARRNATTSSDSANTNKDSPELSILKLYTNEKGDTHGTCCSPLPSVILAENFNPALGSVHVTVPWLDERSDSLRAVFVHYKDSSSKPTRDVGEPDLQSHKRIRG